MGKTTWRSWPLNHYDDDVIFFSLRVDDIMSESVAYIYPNSRIQSIVDILSTTKHHMFPVVTHCPPNREMDEENRTLEVSSEFV